MQVGNKIPHYIFLGSIHVHCQVKTVVLLWLAYPHVLTKYILYIHTQAAYMTVDKVERERERISFKKKYKDDTNEAAWESNLLTTV